MIPATLFAVAAALALGEPAGRQLRRLAPAPAISRRPEWLLPAVLSVCVSGLIWAVLGTRVLGWVVASAVLLATVAWLVRCARVDGQRSRARDDTAGTARALALLIQAGQTPTRALHEVAADSPALAVIAHTGALGGDVVAALRELGSTPGCAGYRRVAAAWHVSEQTGAPIALVLGRVAENLRRERRLTGIVAAELASARASGRIMGCLPFVAIGMGALVGAKPLEFLFGSWPGEVAFLMCSVLVAAGVVWTERIARIGEPVEART